MAFLYTEGKDASRDHSLLHMLSMSKHTQSQTYNPLRGLSLIINSNSNRCTIPQGIWVYELCGELYSLQYVGGSGLGTQLQLNVDLVAP